MRLRVRRLSARALAAALIVYMSGAAEARAVDQRPLVEAGGG
jgi:hypothetical protein